MKFILAALAAVLVVPASAAAHTHAPRHHQHCAITHRHAHAVKRCGHRHIRLVSHAGAPAQLAAPAGASPATPGTTVVEPPPFTFDSTGGDLAAPTPAEEEASVEPDEGAVPDEPTELVCDGPENAAGEVACRAAS